MLLALFCNGDPTQNLKWAGNLPNVNARRPKLPFRENEAFDACHTPLSGDDETIKLSAKRGQRPENAKVRHNKADGKETNVAPMALQAIGHDFFPRRCTVGSASGRNALRCDSSADQ